MKSGLSSLSRSLILVASVFQLLHGRGNASDRGRSGHATVAWACAFSPVTGATLILPRSRSRSTGSRNTIDQRASMPFGSNPEQFAASSTTMLNQVSPDEQLDIRESTLPLFVNMMKLSIRYLRSKIKAPTKVTKNSFVLSVVSEAAALLAEFSSTTINDAMLHKLVLSALGTEPDEAVRKHWRKLITQTTLCASNKLTDNSDDSVGEMYLQQMVFSAVPFLYRLFTTDWTEYKADEEVPCSYLARESITGKELSSNCKPDAAIIIPTMNIVLATMELKRKATTAVDQENDEFKCALVTSMALLALDKAGCGRDIAIPFVIGVDDKASLFVTRFDNSRGKTNPKIVIDKILDRIPFHDNTLDSANEKHKFLATLAVLLSRIVKSATENKIALSQRRPRLPKKGFDNIFAAK